MVATIATAASADYYIHSQASHRPVEEYYLSGEEPDGVWWNPSGVFGDSRAGMGDGGTVDSADFHLLYNGFHPVTGEKLTRNAGSAKRCPGYDLIFNADKTVSALWAVAPPELRERIEQAHDDAVRVALEDIVLRHCAYTRIRDREGTIRPVPADLAAALFRHGAARSNDPHLHTHCVILNVARAHHDGKWRALHGHPLFSWQKAAGAVYRAELAWLLRARLGIAMEVHGRDGQYTRIRETPEALVAEWSKRDSEINGAAAKFGVSLEGNGAFHAAVQRMTRAPKQHGLDPEERHRIWREDAGGIVPELDAFVESSVGMAGEITEEERAGVTRRLEELPERMTEMEAVFHYDDLVRRTADAAGGMLSRKEREDAFRRVLASEKIVRLDRPKPSPDAAASLIHTRAYTSAHNLDTERRIRDTAQKLAASGGFAVPASEVTGKLEQLSTGGHPLSDEQCAAIRAATAEGRVAIVEGAAGSGKTTTLRPVADLYRERGYSVIATAVAWRAALELGSDLDADALCVDKLLAMAARGRAPVDERTVVFVDEAGMLSSAHADRILDLARARGAKLVLAGDTEQQQPVTAGPGLRLVRDVAGSVRVDAMRRQLADAEDALVGLYGKTREDARRRAEAMTEAERAKVLAAYEALPDVEWIKVKPWQIAASEAFRDGDAAAGISAYAERGRFHLGRNLHRTLARLVDDWDEHRKRNPDGSSAVIAETNAETRALSFLMRERVLADNDGTRVTIQACRGRDPKARPEPLEIAPGDRLRIGAPHWEKRLFNGTVLTVLDVEERPPRVRGGEPRAWIRGRTGRGRIVAFHHDEIVDWHGKLRLDHGYALTVASAQGLTVDRCFLLANRRPSRETIYPAATRHRDRLDIYVDRAPVEAAIRARRSEDAAGDPVTDDEVTEHLARAWSRERRKEAAGDYMTPGMKAAVFGARKIEPAHDAPGRVAANDAGDGVLSDLALRIRYGEIEIRHGAAVEGLGKACRGLNRSLAAWDGRRRKEGNAAVAMDPGFRADLRAAGAVLRAARPYMKDDPLHRRLLAERGGIAAADLEELAGRRRRGRSIRDMSIGERRGADPGFVPAPPARRPEEVRIAAIGRALEALEPAVPARDIPVEAVEPSIGTAAAPAKRKPKPKPSPAETRPAAIPASEAEARYNRFLADARENRRVARSQGLHPYETEEAPALIEQARALLRLEALPADRARSLRDDVARYDDWFRSGRPAPKPVLAPANPGPRQKPSPTEPRPAAVSAAEAVTLHRRFLAAAIVNRRAARSRGLHPYQTEEAPALIEQARALLRLETLPADRARVLRNTVAAYDEWFRSRRASEPARNTEQTPRPRTRRESHRTPRQAPAASGQPRRVAPSAKPQPSRQPAPEPRAQSPSTAATPSAAARASEKERAAEKERAENRERNRARIESFLRRAPQIERRHMELSIAAIGQDATESAAARRDWLGDARAVRDEGEALERDIPKRELEEHLAACGAAPIAIELRTHAIRTGIGLVEKDLAEHARREAAERAERDAGRAGEEERARAAQAERTRRREDAAPESGAVPGPDTPQPSDRDRRAAAKLATRLDDCLARRETLLERAGNTLHPSRPVADLGRPHAAWRRKANRAIAAGRELLGNPRYAPLPPRPWRQGPDRGRNRPPRKGRPVRQHAGAHRARLGGGRGPGPRDRTPPLFPRRAPHRLDPDVPVAGEHPGRRGAALRQGGGRAARAHGTRGRAGSRAWRTGCGRARRNGKPPRTGPRSSNGRATANGGRRRTRRCKTWHGYWARGRRSPCTSRNAPGWRRSWGGCLPRSAWRWAGRARNGSASRPGARGSRPSASASKGSGARKRGRQGNGARASI